MKKPKALTTTTSSTSGIVLILVAASFLVGAYAAAGRDPSAAESGALEGRITDASTGAPIPGAEISVPGAGSVSTSDVAGRYRIEGVTAGRWVVECRAPGYEAARRSGLRVVAGKRTVLDFALLPAGDSNQRVEAASESLPVVEQIVPKPSSVHRQRPVRFRLPMPAGDLAPPPFNTESYARIREHPFRSALDEPLSTFSIDVDTASYANLRRFVEREHRLPPVDAVRIEELINYFSYSYADPDGPEPFSVVTEVSDAPWNPSHRLVHIGLQGERVDTADLPPSNLVFLLDVSGSMNTPAKLPLLKAAFRLLVQNLRSEDRVAIVVYAGAAGLALPPTPGDDKETILAALDGLRAGGSTAGGEGIRLAYETARRNFDPEANNRVILATDGDFNIGPSSDAEMTRMIERERDSGVFLSVLGFGTGNYKDSKMEQLADRGNGVAAYIDSVLEAKKVLVREMGGTLLTIAKDVKVQVEFNPARVKGYRLIGYENRSLDHRDFNDDAKDAGELGAGHSVTVLYEVVPADSDEVLGGIDELKYQESRLSRAARGSRELLTVKLRYKEPTSSTSRLVTRALPDESVPFGSASDDFRFSAAVAQFGMLLRDSELKGESSYEAVLEAARAAVGEDRGGYRSDFVELAERAKLLSGDGSAS